MTTFILLTNLQFEQGVGAAAHSCSMQGQSGHEKAAGNWNYLISYSVTCLGVDINSYLGPYPGQWLENL